MSRSEMVHCDFDYPDGERCGVSTATRLAKHWDLGTRDICPRHLSARTPGSVVRELPRAYRGIVTPISRGGET